MAISFRCDACGRSYKTEDRFAGRTVSCKGCGRSIIIQAVVEQNIYGFDEPPPAPPPRRAAVSSPTTRTTPSPTPKASWYSRFVDNKGTVGSTITLIVGIRLLFVIYRHLPGVLPAGPPAPPTPGAPAPLVAGIQTTPRPQSTPSVWTMPVLPQLGPWHEIEPGIQFQEVRLPSRAGPMTLAGHSGKIWVYLPAGEQAPASLPCVLITGAGSTLLTGQSIDDDSRPEHLPYARAGFAVVAYEMDGHPPADDANDQSLAEPAAAFFRAQAGLVNARVAIDFAISRLSMIDPKRLYNAGHSSAGTAALLVAAYDPRIKACAAFAPVVDMNAHFSTIQRLIADRIAPGSSDLFTRYNPRTVENQINCPLFLFCADDDEHFANQVKEMAARLKNQGKNVTLTSVVQGGHYPSMIEQGIPNAISWFMSLSGGDPWRPLADGGSGDVAAGALAPGLTFTRPGIPGLPRGRMMTPRMPGGRMMTPRMPGGRMGPGMPGGIPGRLPGMPGGFPGQIPIPPMQPQGMNNPGG